MKCLDNWLKPSIKDSDCRLALNASYDEYIGFVEHRYHRAGATIETIIVELDECPLSVWNIAKVLARIERLHSVIGTFLSATKDIELVA